MPKLLIVDDELWIRKGLAHAVDWSALGVDCVQEAESAEQALQLAETDPPDVVVTDIRMGVINGLEMIERMRQLAPPPEFIVVSGYQEFEYAREAVKLEVCAFIVKPIEEQKLTQAVKKAFARLAARAGRKAAPQATGQPATAPRLIIQKALDYVDRNYQGAMSLAAVAEHIHLNESYLSKLFFKETGSTFTKYLMKKRIALARALLADPSVKVYEIGEKVGYSDVKYFVKVFKELEGATPSEYRDGLAAKYTKS